MIAVLRDVTPCRSVSCSHLVDQSTSGFRGVDYIRVKSPNMGMFHNMGRCIISDQEVLSSLLKN
jgi:hypothetical protein